MYILSIMHTTYVPTYVYNIHTYVCTVCRVLPSQTGKVLQPYSQYCSYIHTYICMYKENLHVYFDIYLCTYVRTVQLNLTWHKCTCKLICSIHTYINFMHSETVFIEMRMRANASNAYKSYCIIMQVKLYAHSPS